MPPKHPAQPNQNPIKSGPDCRFAGALKPVALLLCRHAAAEPMDLQSLSVGQRIGLLLKALDGAQRTNEALARCSDGEAMLDVLLDASKKLGLGLTRQDLKTTPPIRDWVWWKNKEALLTIGDSTPRYQQDGNQGKGASQGKADPVAGQAPDRALERKKFLGLF